MKVKKVLAMLMSTCLMLGGLMGCSDDKDEQKNSANSENVSSEAEQTEEQEEKDPVTLTWWYPGNGEQADTAKVNDYVNELLKSYPGLEHVTIELHPILMDDYVTQLTLALSADKQVDIITTCYLTPLQTYYDDGIVASMESYMDTVPGIQDVLPDWLLQYGQFDGEQYMIPNYQMAGNMGYINMPAEYIEKGYITREDFEKMADVDTPIEERAALMEQLVYAVREGENTETKYAWNLPNAYLTGSTPSGWYDQISNGFLLREGSDTVTYRWLEEDAKTMFGIAADWYEKGLVPSDPTTDYNTLVKANMMNDVAAVVSGNHGNLSIESIERDDSASYGFDVVAARSVDHVYASSSWAAGGQSITVMCEHPEEAMKFIEALNVEEGKEIYNTIVYGLEGTHWEWVDEASSTIKTLEYDEPQADSSVSYAHHKWLAGNTYNAYLNQACSQEINEAGLKVNEEAVASVLTGCTFDLSSVQSEIDQINAIWGEYKDALIYGSKGADWEAYYDEFVGKLEVAGVDKVIEEIQKQVDAFIK